MPKMSRRERERKMENLGRKVVKEIEWAACMTQLAALNPDAPWAAPPTFESSAEVAAERAGRYAARAAHYCHLLYPWTRED